MDVTCGAQPVGEENRATRDTVGRRKEEGRRTECGARGKRKGGREEIEPRDLANKRGRKERRNFSLLLLLLLLVGAIVESGLRIEAWCACQPASAMPPQ